MKYEWDNNKNQENINKHGIDFNDVVEVFKYPILTAIDERFDYDEKRIVGIGIMKSIVIIVVYVEKANELTRIISARKATKYEREKYEEKLSY